MKEIHDQNPVRIQARVTGNHLHLAVHDGSGWVGLDADKEVRNHVFDNVNRPIRLTLDLEGNGDIYGVSANPAGRPRIWQGSTNITNPGPHPEEAHDFFAVFVQQEGKSYVSDPIVYIRRK